MAAADVCCIVEFTGGPLDGHQQTVSFTAEELNEVVLLPVGKLLACLHEDPAFQQLPGLAVYALLESSADGPRYHYVGAVSPAARGPRAVGLDPTEG